MNRFVHTVVLAGGRGMRLRPHTENLPKPLLPIAGVPVLEIVLRRLRLFGIREVFLAVGYRWEEIRGVLGSGEQVGMNLRYLVENTPLGTVGPIGGLPLNGRAVLAMNGDVISGLDFAEFLAAHRRSGAALTMAVKRQELKRDFGIVRTDDRGFLSRYIEKPRSEHWINTGIYLFEPEALVHIRDGERLDIPELIERLVRDRLPVYCHPHDGYWIDIGRREDYERAQREFLHSYHQLFPNEGSGVAVSVPLQEAR